MRRGLDLLSLVHLGHASHPSASEPGILVAVAPAVNRSLDKSSLAAERNVELGQRPADPVAVRLVQQAVSAVLFLGAACSRVDAVLLLKLWRQLVNVDRLDIAADRVLHLDPVPRVLESDPLNAIAVLPDHERGCRGDRPGCRAGVDTRR